MEIALLTFFFVSTYHENTKIPLRQLTTVQKKLLWSDDS